MDDNKLMFLSIIVFRLMENNGAEGNEIQWSGMELFEYFLTWQINVSTSLFETWMERDKL